MQSIFFPAESRGGADYGWLKTRYSFSFAEYFDPERMGFGALRVLNDDWIAGGAGFPPHAHADMEIITIPFSGALAHEDDTGGSGVVRAGDVQVMSAGTGVTHSEFNHSPDKPVTLFQIWIMTRRRGVQPRYAEKTFDPKDFRDAFFPIVGPDETGGKLMIHQDAWLSLGHFESARNIVYRFNKPDNGVFVIAIEGSAIMAGRTLGKRDAIGIVGAESVTMETQPGSRLLAIEVPMR